MGDSGFPGHPAFSYCVSAFAGGCHVKPSHRPPPTVLNRIHVLPLWEPGGLHPPAGEWFRAPSIEGAADPTHPLLRLRRPVLCLPLAPGWSGYGWKTPQRAIARRVVCLLARILASNEESGAPDPAGPCPERGSAESQPPPSGNRNTGQGKGFPRHNQLGHGRLSFPLFQTWLTHLRITQTWTTQVWTIQGQPVFVATCALRDELSARLADPRASTN